LERVLAGQGGLEAEELRRRMRHDVKILHESVNRMWRE
jgi:hypothetical protein